ncbi:MAG TPA: POTRA domain-containing protein, partial [Chitinophagaceae bacterium]|nr:POTRA domain-containing protein [Chitinophagaceae bacterium]
MSAGFIYAQPGMPDLSVTDTSINDFLKKAGGQQNLFTVREIAISGNKKTKESVILRELPFKSGD